MAERRIEAVFREFPALWPLRDRYIERLQSKFYSPKYFRPCANALWPLVRALGKQSVITHAWFDGLPKQYHLARLLRSELVSSGLLPPLLEHPGIGRYNAIAARMLAEITWKDELDRRLVERFVRMHLVPRLRKRLSKATDRDLRPVRAVQTHLRHILRFVSIVEAEGRTFRNFTKDDIEAAWGNGAHGLFLLLQWFAKEGVGKERFIPKTSLRDDGYAGIGTPALRENIATLLALDAEPSVQLAGLLSYCGVLGTELALLRASDVLPNGDIKIGGKVFHLHETIARFAITLQQSLLEQVRTRRPVGWDPWLFAPADALEGPTSLEILWRLRELGIDVRPMRTDGQRLSSQQPFEAYAIDQNLKRGRNTTMKHLKVFASEAGSYAILLANEQLKPS